MLNSENKMISGAEAIVQILIAYEVKFVFGVPGDTRLPLYDALYKNSSKIKKDYDVDEWWGYKKARDLKEDKKIFGVKLILPYEKIE